MFAFPKLNEIEFVIPNASYIFFFSVCLYLTGQLHLGLIATGTRAN